MENELLQEQQAEEASGFAQEQEKRARELILARLDSLGQSLAKTRSEAIAARQNSGIEEEWYEDEEFYQGIDDANRGEHRTAQRTKPPGQAGRMGETVQTRSTVFPNITSPYVDAAAARIADMLLPTDDRAWGLKPTPVPELAETAKATPPPGLIREVEARYPGQPELAKKELAIAVQAATEVLAEAKAKADKAQTRIEDWHVECQYHSHVRQVIEDAARIGTGVLKGPVPVNRKGVKWDGKALTITAKLAPKSKWLDPWNLYPDPACGENIHNGAYIWERDSITRKQLRELMGQEGYIKEQIQTCLDEGPQRVTGEYKPTPDAVGDESVTGKNKYEIWYFHGTVEREDIEAAGCDCGEEADPHIPAMVVLVNNRVIKATLNPLDTGDFPYDVMVWRRRSGHWTGIGVARQIRTPQRIVTAGTRNLMDNAGIAGGPMIVFRQGVVTPADGKHVIAPRKIWYIAEDHDEMIDATKAIGVVQVDMLVNELLRIIELGMKLAEDVTGMPMLLQGQMGKAPDTLGVVQVLNNNSSTVLRRLAKLFDDRVTEPHVRRYYTWLLQYGDESEKGDFSIDARGSSALVERDLQNQAIMQMGNIVVDPRFGLDPKKWAQEMLKSQHLDAKRFEFDDEKWQQIVENMAQGTGDPRVEVAQLRADVEMRIAAAEQAFEERENDKDRALKAWLAEMERQGTQSITIDQLKVKLASDTIKTQTQLQLSKMDSTRQALKPPTEPRGRAQRGKAFQQ